MRSCGAAMKEVAAGIRGGRLVAEDKEKLDG
jgi:hypothetical protein